MDDVIYVGMPACEEDAPPIELPCLWRRGCALGDLDGYLRGLADTIPDHLDAIWKHCVGYPGAANRQAFIHYMKACQLDTTFYFAAVNGKFSPPTRCARCRPRPLATGFIATHRNADAATLQREFIQFLALP